MTTGEGSNIDHNDLLYAVLYPNPSDGSSASGWSFANGGGVAGNDSGFTSGDDVAPEGTQVAFLQGNGSMTQFANFAAGTYTVSFEAAQRYSYFESVDQTVEVLVDGKLVGTFDPTNDSSYHSETTGSFTVAAGEHAIEFLGVDPNNIDITAFVDEVEVNDAGSTTATPPSLVDAGFEDPNVGPNRFIHSSTAPRPRRMRFTHTMRRENRRPTPTATQPSMLTG